MPNKKRDYILSSIILLFVLLAAIKVPYSLFDKNNTDAVQQSFASTERTMQTLADNDPFSWPMFQQNQRHTGYSSSNAPQTNTTLWISQPSNMITKSSPTVANGKVYLGYSDDTFYCLDAATGENLWIFSTGGPVYSSPAVTDEYVYFYAGDGKLYCLYAINGSERWNFSTQEGYFSSSFWASSPTVVNGKIYFGSYDNKVYCLQEDTGELIWSFTAGDDVVSSPAVYHERVYIGSLDNHVYCLAAEGKSDGTTYALWNTSLEGQIYSSPLVTDSYVFVGERTQATMYCLYASNGTRRWSFVAGSSFFCSSPAIVADRIYVGGNGVSCRYISNGTAIWTHPAGGSNVRSSLVIADGKVYTSSQLGLLYCYDAVDGTVLWMYQMTDTGFHYSSPVIADGKLYIPGGSKLYCFRDNTGPDIPAAPNGPSQGEALESLTFTTQTTDSDNDEIYYQWKIGPYQTTWLGPYASDTEAYITYAFSEVGTYTVEVKAKDHELESGWSESHTVQITARQPLLQIIAPLTVIEQQEFVVSIRETTTDQKIPNAMVRFNNELQITNDDGQVSFQAPEVTRNAEYTITASHDIYTAASSSIMVLDIKEKIGWIYGVVASSSGLPLNEATVTITQDYQSWIAFTNSEGVYVKAVPPGIYTVQASKQGYVSQIFLNMEITDNTALDANFNLEEITIPPVSDQKNNNDILVESAVQTAINNGYVGAKISLISTNEKPTLHQYIDEIYSIELVDSTELLSFKVSAESQDPGTFFIVYLGNNVLLNQEEINIYFDGNKVSKMPLENFLTPEKNNEVGYILLSTADGTYAAIYVPSFSEHIITLSLIQEIITEYKEIAMICAFGIIILATVFLFRKGKEN